MPYYVIQSEFLAAIPYYVTGSELLAVMPYYVIQSELMAVIPYYFTGSESLAVIPYYLTGSELLAAISYYVTGSELLAVIPFYFIFTAVGCPHLANTDQRWVRVTGSHTLTAGCRNSERSWHLRCQGNRWVGTITNCSHLQGESF